MSNHDKRYGPADIRKVIDLKKAGFTREQVHRITAFGKNAIAEMGTGRYGCKRNETKAGREQKARNAALRRLMSGVRDACEPLGLELLPRHARRYRQVVRRRSRMERAALNPRNRKKLLAILVLGDALC